MYVLNNMLAGFVTIEQILHLKGGVSTEKKPL